MELKTALAVSSAFMVGLIFGCLLSLHAASRALGSADLDAMAMRSVDNVAEAYEAQLQKSGIFERMKAKMETCAQENSKLTLKLWRKRCK